MLRSTTALAARVAKGKTPSVSPNSTHLVATTRVPTTPSLSRRSLHRSITNRNRVIYTASAPSNHHKPTTASAASLATMATPSTSQTPLSSLPPGYEVKKAVDAAPPIAVFARPLEVSSSDDRKYRLLTLPNGLEALVIQDATTDKSAAAMDVRVGHLSDPENLQGLAHFCEHLLFLGTEKYPRENEYSEYLTHHSGSSNAYTGMDNTNYFFDVGHPHLEGALDRFAQFFLHPLFDPSCSEREIRAVDSEHKKNLQSDAWRAFQLEKSLSDPAHPYSHFGTGSAKTLWDAPRSQGIDVRDELLKFHDRYYSANVMKLVVLGRESLDQLTQWVVDKFSGVKNKGLAAPTFPTSPLGKEQLQTQVFFRSVKDIRMVDVTFPIPDQGPHFRTKPAEILSHFVGHEGQGSILSHLKSRGWANHLSAGATNGADGFDFFKISVDLTQEGLANYSKVVAAIFHYLDLLKTSGIEAWVHEEIKRLCDLGFRFKEKSPPSSYVSAVSSQMQQPYPREWILSAPYLTREFDLDVCQKTLACLTPDNCRVFVAAQQLPDGSREWGNREKWYGTEYQLTSLPKDLLNLNAAETGDLKLPKPNSFIPTDFNVDGAPPNTVTATPTHAMMVTPRPVLIRNTPAVRLWHKKDDRFYMPKANIFMIMRNPLIDATPANAVKSRLFVELVKDALTEYSYDAELAGLGYNIEAQADGIGLSVDGYNDKLPTLCKYILNAIARFQVDPARFEVIKDQVQRMYENFKLEAPYQHANYYTTYLLIERMWTAEEKLGELRYLQPEDVQRFIPEVLGRLHIELLAHGNVKPEAAEELADLVVKTLSPRSLSPSELVSHRSLILPRPCNLSWTRDVANKENVNSSIEYFLQVGDSTDLHLRAKLSLLAQIMQEPCFDQLRTKEQLGYLVFSSLRKGVGSMGIRILVQSERDSRYVESRIDAFFDSFRATLEAMPDSEFEAHKSSLIQKRLEVVKNMQEESSRYWYHIHSGYYDFLQRDKDVSALRPLSRQDVLDVFMTHVHPSSPNRSKLAVHMRSQVEQIRFSVRAADALQAAAKQAGLDASSDAYDTLRAQQPSVETVKEHTKQTLSAKGGVADSDVQSFLQKIDELAAEFPFIEAESPEAISATKSNAVIPLTEVEDAVALKAQLIPSSAAVPVAQWIEFEKKPEARPAQPVGIEAEAETTVSKANL